MPGNITSVNMQMTMGEAFRQVAASRREQEALVCGAAHVTYGYLLDRADALAQGLCSLGLGKGDKVALLLPPGPEFVFGFLAVARLGGIVVPLNPQLRQRGLIAILQDAQPTALIGARPGEGSLSLAELGDARACLRHVIWVGEAPQPPGEREGDLSLDEVMAAGTGASVCLPDVAPGDLLALLYTSGTTGTPKGTMHTHRTLIAPVVASLRLRELWLRRPGVQTLGKMAKALVRYRERLLRAAGRPQTFLSTTGWHTVTGLEVMLQGILMGDRLVVMPRFHPREALEWIERERVTVLVAVPTALQVMLSVQASRRAAGEKPYDTSSLLICGTGSAPCPPNLAREIRRSWGCAVHIGFGATETGGGIAATDLADPDDRQAETVGRPMPGVEVKVVDEQRRVLPPGQVGELACRGDSIMLGYYGAPEATAEVIDQEGWYYTGDLAQIDEQGYVRIVGRKKDVIIRGGQNIYPAEIETYLASHEKIREVAVVGVPSRLGGESMWAVLLLEEGAEMTEQEALDYCRAALEPYQIPSRVRFVADFPRSETGKPQKFRLREMVSSEERKVPHPVPDREGDEEK